MVRRRVVACAAAAVTVAAGLAVRGVFAGDAAKYAGDMLYTVLLYTLVLAAAPRPRPLTVAAVALGVSWLVEFAQLTGVPAELAAHSAVARLVLGTTFNPPDLAWYAVAALLCCLAHGAAMGARRRRRAREAIVRPADPA
ncbi:DUF2809 domain-containing protein [Sphaerisporangium sp. NPDC005288]|uniref:ribosomal maturation YjgA family protein n=1 Tax=unclassified Sphaerisporangium TaxID=2630420 RepID=UPI0033B2FCCE